MLAVFSAVLLLSAPFGSLKNNALQLVVNWVRTLKLSLEKGGLSEVIQGYDNPEELHLFSSPS